MKDKLTALAGDLREQAATALETTHSMALDVASGKSGQTIYDYANHLAGLMAETADELEQIAGEGDFKQKSSFQGLRFFKTGDNDEGLFLKSVTNGRGYLMTLVYAWVRRQDDKITCDVRMRRSGKMLCLLSEKYVPETINDLIFLMQGFVEDISHEIVPMEVEGNPYD